MAGKRKVVPPIALALDKRQFWIDEWYPIITAIIAEFGSVEECVEDAHKWRKLIADIKANKFVEYARTSLEEHILKSEEENGN